MRARVLAVVVAAVAVAGNVAAGGAAATAAVCAPPEVRVIDAQPQYEGSEGGTKTVALTVTMAAPAAGCPASGSVRYRTLDGTAAAGPDYVAATATITWATPGPRVVAVQLVRDDQHEQDELFAVELFGPRGVGVADSRATVTILDDDPSATGGGVVVAVPNSGICWWPSDHCAIPVRLDTIARAPVAVRLRTLDGTAVAGKDYLPVKDRIVTVPAGADHVDVPVGLLAGAAPGEFFGVEISDTTAGTIGVARARITLREG